MLSTKRVLVVTALMAVSSTACGDDASDGSTAAAATTSGGSGSTGGSGGSATTTGSGAVGSGGSATTTTSTGAAGGATCAMGMSVPAGRLCVRGEAGPSGEALTEGGKLYFEVFPAGCFSSSCTTLFSDHCVAAGPGLNKFIVEPTFCIGVTGQSGCTDDCGGGGVLECPEFPAPKGSFTVETGDLSVAFTVPSDLPAGGTCSDAP